MFHSATEMSHCKRIWVSVTSRTAAVPAAYQQANGSDCVPTYALFRSIQPVMVRLYASDRQYCVVADGE